MVITGLFAARAGVLEPGGERSAILKRPQQRVRVTVDGIVGDEQADRRYHGGPDQALHQFALKTYTVLTQAWPALAGIAMPGSIGENLSCPALDEDTVCVGDCFRIGEVEVQVTQPRRPCSKIDARYGVHGIAKFIHEQRMPGWYLRVLQAGHVAIGDQIELIARPNPDVTLARLLAVNAEHRPAVAELEKLVNCAGLGADWRKRLGDRLAFMLR